jgi:hypothetical protein
MQYFQTLFNCSAIEYKRTKDNSDLAFKSAVISALSALPDASVHILAVADASVAGAGARGGRGRGRGASRDVHSPPVLQGLQRDFQGEGEVEGDGEASDALPARLVVEASATKAVTVTYLYSVVIEAAGFSTGQSAFDYATAELEYSISSGAFIALIHAAAMELNSPGLAWVSNAADGLNIHTDFLVVNGSPRPSSEPTHRFKRAGSENSLEIIGPALVLVLLILSSVIVYHRYIRNGIGEDNFVPLSQDSEGYDEIELMEKKAQMLSLSQHGTNPLHKLIKKNRKNGYAKVIKIDENSQLENGIHENNTAEEDDNDY